MYYPTIAIIGRPNVGKSSFFNRLVKKRYAIVSDVAGTTRDRIYDVVERDEYAYLLVDTGGIMDDEGEIEENVQKQAYQAIEDADLIVFMLDGRDELTTTDREIFEMLSRGNKPFMVVINKIDGPNWEIGASHFYELGAEEMLFISASHGYGVPEFENLLRKMMKKHALLVAPLEKSEDHTVTKIALVGAPNVGKSSLVNAILGESRLIEADIPGTTRDATDSDFIFEGKQYKLIDTAGLRRRGKVEKGIEKYSALRTLRAISRCDVALLIIDAKRGITHQEKAVVSYILKEQKGVMLVVNKWDIVEDKDESTMNRFIEYLRSNFEFLPYAPAVFVSAKTKQRVFTMFDIINNIMDQREKRIDTGELNRFFELLVAKRPPHGTKQTLPKLKYATQIGVHPPHFVLFVNSAPAFHFSYLRYLENRLRDKYDFTGTPIVLELKEGIDRFEGRKKPRKERVHKK